MAKRKRNNGVPPPVTVELMWVKDDDGTILRWADITDYDACAKAPHDPRTYILRLADNTAPRGKRLHNMANWAGWRKAIREIPVNELREWTACGGNTKQEEGSLDADILIACAVAARDALVYAQQLLSDTPEAKAHITNIIDAVEALTRNGEVAP